MFDFFKKEPPKLKWATVNGWYSIDYNVSNQVFYDFYNQNPYISATISRIKTDVWWHGIELVKKMWTKNIPKDLKMLETLLSYQQKTSVKDFTEKLVRDIEITGNAYVYVARNKNNRVFWMKTLDPRYITPIVKNTWELLWYVQNLNWIRAFLPTEVYHFMDEVSTEDETIWTSKMKSLFIDLETDKEARESNLAFFKNNQTPSSIVLIDDDFEIEDEAVFRKKLQEIFLSWKYQGWKNHYRTAFFQWIKNILPIQDKIDDMKFIWLRRLTMQLVCAVYQVPQDLLWFTETSNRSVWDVQYDIYLNTINAKEHKLEKFINPILEDIFDDTINIVFLQDNLRQLEKKSKIAIDLYKNGRLVSLDEAREIIQYEATTDWDKFFSWDNKNLEKEENQII